MMRRRKEGWKERCKDERGMKNERERPLNEDWSAVGTGTCTTRDEAEHSAKNDYIKCSAPALDDLFVLFVS